MGQGYTAGRGDSIKPLVRRLQTQQRQLNEQGRPPGVDIAQLYDQVQNALINLDASVQASISANSYTKAQIDSKITSPGAITPSSIVASGDITANGRLISTGIINSPGTKANTVTVGYSAVYADTSGNFGANTSTRRSKTNLQPLDVDLDALLELQGFRFQRHTDVLEMGETAPWQSGFMAEDVEQVAPLNVWHDENGLVEGIRYEELVVPLLLAVARERQARLDAEARYTELDARVRALEGINS